MKKNNVKYTISDDNSLLGVDIQIEENGTIRRLEELIAKYKKLFPDYHTRYRYDLTKDPVLHEQIKNNKAMSLAFLDE